MLRHLRDKTSLSFSHTYIFDYQQEQSFSLFSYASRPEADHPGPHCAKVKNVWRYTSIPSYTFSLRMIN